MTLLVIAAVLLALGLLYLLRPHLFIIPILLILYRVNPGQSRTRRGKTGATGRRETLTGCSHEITG